MELPEFIVPPAGSNAPAVAFVWLSDTVLAVDQFPGPQVLPETDISPTWAGLEEVISSLANTDQGHSKRLNIALSRALTSISRRTSGAKYEIKLSSSLLELIDDKKRPRVARQMALHVASTLVSLEKDGMHQIARTAFPVLADVLKSGLSSSSSSTGYKAVLIGATTATVRAADPTNVDFQTLKSVFNLAKANALDSALIVARASWQLMEAAVMPALISSSSKFDKLGVLFMKAANNESLTIREAAASFYATLVSRLESKELESERDTADETREDWSSAAAAAAAAPQASAVPATKVKVTAAMAITLKCNQYAAASTTKRQSTTIVQFFVEMIRRTGAESVVKNYKFYLQKFSCLGSGQKMTDYRKAVAAQHVRYLLVDIVAGEIALSDKSRLELIQAIIQQLATTPADRLDQAALLMPSLWGVCGLAGSSVSPFADQLSQACLSLLESSQQLETSLPIIEAMGHIVESAPWLILGLMTFGLQKITASTDIKYAYLISVLVAKWQKFPTYVSLELIAQVLSTASSLIKQAQNGHPEHDFPKYDVGWVLLEGVLRLGPSVMKLYVSQLLQLWKSVLDKPETASNNANPVEIKFSLKFRERALTGLMVFMAYNGALVTPDVTRQFGLLLHMSWTYVEGVPARFLSTVEVSLDEKVVRRRLLECYYLLSEYDKSDIYPASVLTRSISYVATPESHIVTDFDRLSTAVAVNEKWSNLADNVGAGLSSLVLSPSASSLESIEQLPTAFALHYDPDRLIIGGKAYPLLTAVVDASIGVLVRVLPIQHIRVQESLLDRLRSQLNVVSTGSSGSASHRYKAVKLNISYLVEDLLRHARSDDRAKVAYQNGRINRILVDILKVLVTDQEAVIRARAANSFGLLASATADHELVAELIKYLIDAIVGDLNPIPRSGFARALGKIMELAPNHLTSAHLKSVISVLVPLAKDPHPLVHIAAIESLNESVANAGIVAIGYSQIMLKSLLELYLLESHSEMVDSEAYSNIEIRSSVSTIWAIVQGFNMLVSLLGPELVSYGEINEILRLLDQSQSPEMGPVVISEAWSSLLQVFYFAPKSIVWARTIKLWVSIISNPYSDRRLRHSAAYGLLAVARKSARWVSEVAGPVFEIIVWVALDQNAELSSLKQLIMSWVDQTGALEPAKWIARLQKVIMRPRYMFEDVVNGDFSRIRGGGSNFNETENVDEDASLGPQGEQTSNELLGWRTRQFATQCLTHLLKSLLQGKSEVLRRQSPISKNIGDVIKIAFSAATSPVISMQFAGLELLDEVVTEFSDVSDPDFPDSSLLEQYQAQISSALTPAFAADSSPELASSALHVCGTFISSGVVKNPEKFGRILRILTTALNTADSSSFTLGEMRLGPNGVRVLRISVLRVWAIFQSASRQKPFLEDILKDHQDTLVPLWISTLRDYSKLNFEPEQSSVTSFAASLDQMHAVELRHVPLATYQTSWLELVSALASLIELQGPEILEINGAKADEFLFVLVGLCFSALLQPRTAGHPQLSVLNALRRILLPGVCASVIYDEGIFNETLHILDRIALTGTPLEQAAVVAIARNLAKAQAESDESVDHLFEIFRVCTLPLRNLFPSLTEPGKSTHDVVNTDENLELIKLTLEALIDIIPVFREIIQNDLYVCVLFIFEKITEQPEAQAKVVPHIFTSYKHLIDVMSESYKRGNAETQDMLRTAISTVFVEELELFKEATDATSLTNRMLSGMVVLVANPVLLEGAVGNIVEYARHAAQLLSDPTLSKVTSESIKAVLTAAARQSKAVEGAFVQGCVPGLLEALVHSTDNQTPKLVCNLLVKYANLQTSADSISTALALVIPALLYTVNKEDWLTTEHRELYVQALLLNLLQHHTQEFRDAVLASPNEDIQTLQRLLVVKDAQSNTDEQVEVDASIQLTSFS